MRSFIFFLTILIVFQPCSFKILHQLNLSTQNNSHLQIYNSYNHEFIQSLSNLFKEDITKAQVQLKDTIKYKDCQNEQQYTNIKIDLIHQWFQTKFAIPKVEQVADIISKFTTYGIKNFQGLPFSYIVYTLDQIIKQSFNISQINFKIKNATNYLKIKYPPSTSNQQITPNQVATTFMDPLKWNLFQNSFFNNYQELFVEVTNMNDRAIHYYQQFKQFIQPLCQIKGFQFQSSTKMTKDADKASFYRNHIRIFQKIFLKDIKVETFYDKLSAKIKKSIKITELLSVLFQTWIQDINMILKSKVKNNQPTIAQIHDLIRARAQFVNQDDIYTTIKLINAEAKKRNYKIIILNNRLLNITKDVVLTIMIKGVVAEVQLALDYDDAQYAFNHALYQINRSPYGPLFGSLLWLSKQKHFNFLNKLPRKKVIKAGRDYSKYQDYQKYLIEKYRNLSKLTHQ